MIELMEISQKELNDIIEKHRKWLIQEEGGERASLDHASLKYASLNGANLNGASLDHASLKYASLNGASLDHASLDYSAWPLWCGSLDAKIDDRITIQLLYHTLSASLQSEYVSKEIKDALIPLLPIANRFHHVYECGEIQPNGTRVHK